MCKEVIKKLVSNMPRIATKPHIDIFLIFYSVLAAFLSIVEIKTLNEINLVTKEDVKSKPRNNTTGRH